jgi:hypothetical protein
MNENKRCLVQIGDEQMVTFLVDDMGTIIHNLKNDLKRGFYLNVEDSLATIKAMNEVIEYYGGVPVKFKIPKKHMKKIGRLVEIHF